MSIITYTDIAYKVQFKQTSEDYVCQTWKYYCLYFKQMTQFEFWLVSLLNHLLENNVNLEQYINKLITKCRRASLKST